MALTLDSIDVTQTLSKEESLTRIAAAQRRLTHLRLFTAGLVGERRLGPGLVVIFEGFDAAGKGGAIRRLTAGLDPRHVRVLPVGTPTPEELAHHFLWRFQSSLPPRGGMTVYDRSWYGRLLVERVEEEISSDVASRSAKEIVDFESALVADGTTIIKFWMHISDDEQLRRFQERESNPLKQWKLTPEDWRNRDKRAAYENAADAMFSSTDHHGAHWNLIPAENKHFARVAVLETLIARWEHDLEKRGFAVPPSQGNDYLA